ncbi:DUF4272 domain-containing protein [Chitinophaga nivalis]|uniref:DUF4272 domain-containing protein n=1 Tax=Chitinophaga nivalis TaxID=2991709 RepID=A0ABT3IPZ2_9BACT|nr:DUF4272 domain-containing protein [Chitinophaga nivalis]MCW3464268.1 DUF4272 domain-containing protein [Chitinophaga nivalis]MCW3486041.1 DUF4272 domain-containing protein [Chitinophaga nivalis]
MENCTLYTHEVEMEKVLACVRAHFGASAVTVKGPDHNWESISIRSGKKLLRKGNTLSITYRQRAVPGYELLYSDDPVTANLMGMHGFVQQLPADNPALKELLLAKITTINTEIAMQAEPAFNGELRAVVMEMAQELDGIFFSEKNFIFNTPVQGFWDKSGALLLDVNGHATATHLAVNIHAKYFDAAEGPSPEAAARKDRSLEQLTGMQVKSSVNLPVIVDENAVVLRTAREVAERTAILAAVNAVAFGYLDGSEVVQYLQQNQLWDKTTDAEKTFLDNPTPDDKTRETWKCEDVWVLLWALHKIPSLGYINDLCNLDMVPETAFPFKGPASDPAAFLNDAVSLRSATEILDANDLYYRAHWACVDARLKGEQEPVHPGIVYERHYALNWLINYRNQPWDDVTCDT